MVRTFASHVSLLGIALSAMSAFSQSVFEINPDSARRYISPAIYGVNTVVLTKDNVNSYLLSANLKAERIGGNRLTAYNWENNYSNAGSDWIHNSDDHLINNPVKTAATPGGTMTTFMDRCKSLNEYATIQLPLAGYVAADNGGSVTEEQVAPSARWKNVVFQKGSAFATTPSVSDENVYIDEFVNFMVQKYGKASEGGVKSYCLDNEPGLWSSTHARIVPTPLSIDTMIARSVALSKAVKSVDPSVEILGYEAFGWMEYLNFYQSNGWDNYKSNYDWAISAYLGEMKKKSTEAGMRLLDVLTVHWYPEAKGDKRICEDTAGTESTIQARLQAPRSLWDSTYVETSWITSSNGNKPINLIPRLKKSIDTSYPGTKLGITEYNYGGSAHISGGLALCDVLGVFGSKGVYVANYHESVKGFLAPAFQMYQNFDGKSSTYGDTSVAALSPNAEEYSVYASIDSKSSKLLHIMLINKKSTESAVTFQIKGTKQYKSGIVYALTKDSVTIGRLKDVDPITDNNVSYTVPGYAVLHFILSTDNTVDLLTKTTYTLNASTLGNGKILQSANGMRFTEGSQVTLTAVPDSGWSFDGWVGTDSSRNNAITITMNSNKTVQAQFSSSLELIPNGNFSNGTANWSLNTWSEDGSSKGTASVVDGVLTYVIQNGGPETWNIQIFQNTLSYVKGKKYTLSFDAWALEEHGLNVYAAKGALSKTITLGTTKPAASYTYTFTADSSDAAGRLSFDMGGKGAASAGTVYLDNVSLKIDNGQNPVFRNPAGLTTKGTEFIVYSGKGVATTLYSKSTSGLVTLSICDLSGRVVASLYNGDISGKRMTFNVNKDVSSRSKTFASGMYIIRLQTQGASESCRMLIK
ncbi:MAG: glycoside hydrolase family 44 protein [Fibrobacterota bacterium]|nr:glycoside hydrolase family 44 protein [Chitinispirillaceae bacterium]